MKNFRNNINSHSLKTLIGFQSFNFPIFQFSNLLILSFLIFNSSFLISQNALDNLTYYYNANTNQLNFIADGVIGSPSVVDLEGQGGDNYAYDASGQLINDVSEGILDIEWTVSGKVKQVSIDDNGDLVADRTLQFKYDPLGDRVKKIETTISSGTSISTYYIRNATGELISTYKDDGSGVERGEIALAVGTDNGTSDSITSGVYTRNVGYKNYELKDHLGSVRVSISDTKEPEPGLTTFNSQLTTSTDYQSYGALMAGRDYNSESYKYGYQGKEKDNEIKGNGNSYDFGARLLDPRVGRWLSIDPLADQFANVSPYNAMANNPNSFIDPDGKIPLGLIYLYSLTTTNAHAPISEQGTIDASKMDEEQAGEQMMVAETALGFTPVGPIIDAKDMAQAVAAGSILGVGAAGVGFIPFGDLAKPFLRGLGRYARGADAIVGLAFSAQKRSHTALLKKLGIDLLAINKINYANGDNNCMLTTLSMDEYLASGNAWTVDGSKPNWGDVNTFWDQAGVGTANIISAVNDISFVDDVLQEGDRAIVHGIRVDPKTGGSVTGHVFNAAKIDGETIFMDAQLGSVIDLDEISGQGYSSFDFAVTGKIGDRK